MPDDASVRITATDETTPVFNAAANSAASLASKVNDLGDVFGSFASTLTQAHAAVDATQTKFASMGGVLDGWASSVGHAGVAASATAANMHEIQEKSSWIETFGERIAEFIEHPVAASQEAVKGFIEKLGAGGVVALAAGAAVAELAHEMFELVNEEGLAARQTQNLGNMLGLTFDQTKKLSEMARLVDSDINGLVRASFRLAEGLRDPAGSGKQVADVLKEMGVEATEAGPALLEVLEKLAAIPDKTERIEKAHKLLSRASYQLLPLIENYDKLSEAVEALGGQLDKNQVDKLLEAREKTNELSLAWEHLKEAIAAVASKPVTIVVKYVTSVVSGAQAHQGVTRDEAMANSIELEGRKALEAALSESEHWSTDVGMTLTEQIAKKNKEVAENWKRTFDHTVDGMKRSLEDIEGERKKLEASLANPKTFNVVDESKLKVLTAQAEKLKADLKAAEQDPAKAKDTAIEAETAHQKALIQVARTGFEERAKDLHLDAEVEAGMLKAFVQQELDIEEEGIKRRRALKFKTPDAERDTQLAGKMTAAADHASAQMAEIDAHASEKQQTEFEKRVAATEKYKEAEIAAEVKVFEQKQELDFKRTADERKAREIDAETGDEMQEKEITRERDHAAFLESVGRISASQRLAIEQNLDSQMARIQEAAVQRQIKLLNPLDTDYATKRAGLDKKLAELDAARLDRQQKDTEKALTTQEKLYKQFFDQLTEEQAQMIGRWATGQESFVKAFQDAEGRLVQDATTSIAKLALRWAQYELTKVIIHKSSQVQMDAIDQAANASIFATLARRLAQWVSMEFQKLFAHKAVSTAIKIDDATAAAETIATKAAETAGNAAAATSDAGLAATEAAAAAAPEGPVAAIAAGAAVAAAMAPFVGMAAASGGWDVPAGGPFPTMLHHREMVLPEGIADNVRNATGGSGRNLYLTIPPGTRRPDLDNTLDHLRQLHKSGRLNFLTA